MPDFPEHDLGERILTVMVTDVEASTRLTTRRGDQAARDVLRAHEEIVRTALDRHGAGRSRPWGTGCSSPSPPPAGA